MQKYSRNKIVWHYSQLRPSDSFQGFVYFDKDLLFNCLKTVGCNRFHRRVSKRTDFTEESVL